MPQFIKKPTQIKAAGNLPKVIREYIGRVNSKTSKLSLAHMKSPKGWVEPGQTPEFDEFTLVLKGELVVKTKEKTCRIKAGQAIIVNGGEWVQYKTPSKGAEYIAVCLPAFSPNTVHRDV
jgi:ethanolamine utilization protein EutQ (cupin superfamily)